MNHHDHMVDAMRYAFEARNYPKIPWYKLMFFRVKWLVRRLGLVR